MQKKKGGFIAIVVCGIVIVCLVAVIIVLLNKQPEDEEKQLRNVVVTSENVEDVIAAQKEDDYVAPGSYEVTMNTTWNFPDGASESSNAYVENSTSNTNAVYFDISLKDTEEVIYSSPVLPIGSHLENITLDKDLDAGTYDCIMKYTLVDDDQNELSTVQVSLTIIVEK